MKNDYSMVVRILLTAWVVGAGLAVAGGLMNLAGRLPRRPDSDKGLGGIHDRTARRFGPPTWRIGIGLMIVASPLAGGALLLD
jgi:hypothetical protein